MPMYTGGHYPAPYKIIDLLQNNMNKSKPEHISDEANKFIELTQTKESEALIGNVVHV